MASSRRPVSSAPPTSHIRVLGDRAARILLADADPVSRGWLKPILETLKAEVAVVESGSALQKAIRSQETIDLVVAAARLPAPSGLQVLAAARAEDRLMPFIVITSFQHGRVRVFVSDSTGTVLSSRVVDGENLAVLASTLIEDSAGRSAPTIAR